MRTILGMSVSINLGLSSNMIKYTNIRVCFSLLISLGESKNMSISVECMYE